MVRSSFVDSNGMKKGAWSEDEDNKLSAYIQRYGHWNWRLLPKYAGLARCGKSCRLRWMNYLRPGVKRGNFSKEEEDLIRELHDKLGNKWSAIATKLPGRSDNEIKNFWHTGIEKCRKRSQSSANFKGKTNFEASMADEALKEEKSYEIGQNHFYPEFHDNSLSSSDLGAFDRNMANDDLSVISSDSAAQQIQRDFWSQSFVSNTCNSESENGYLLPREVGGIFDHPYFDPDMNLF